MLEFDEFSTVRRIRIISTLESESQIRDPLDLPKHFKIQNATTLCEERLFTKSVRREVMDSQVTKRQRQGTMFIPASALHMTRLDD